MRVLFVVLVTLVLGGLIAAATLSVLRALLNIAFSPTGLMPDEGGRNANLGETPRNHAGFVVQVEE